MMAVREFGHLFNDQILKDKYLYILHLDRLKKSFNN